MEETRGEVYGASPTDRVEKLLQKYKSRQAVKSSDHLTPSRELEAWNLVNDELQLHGYHPVPVAMPTDSSLSKACVVLDEASSVALRQTLLRLMEEVKRKDGMVQDLLNALRSSKGYQPEFVTPPTRTNRPMRGLDASHMTDPMVQKLQSQVARLEYENSQLKIELQNRPELHELKKSERRVRELEREVQQCKKLLSSEQVDMLHSQQQIKTVCSLLRVRDGREIVPRITSLVGRVEAANSLEKHLASVLDIIYHPSAPRVSLPVGDPPPAKPLAHDLWCEVTWGHVTLMLQEWLRHLRGLQELVLVFREVCLKLHLPSSSDDEDDDDGLLLPLSCGEMATLVRQWLVRKGNMKNATTQALQAMVKHFQELFDVPKLEGVYPRMNQVYQHTEEARNIFKHIKSSLGLEPTHPNRALISMVETLASSENGQLLLQINRQFGIREATTVVEKLRMCEEFFPAFQAVIAEIQEFLGVDSLSAITPALYSLQASHSHRTLQ